MQSFDVAPFGLPGATPGELFFEEPRDIEALTLQFRGSAPDQVKVEYRRQIWPQRRVEQDARVDLERPCSFGWMPLDDWFNAQWHAAKITLWPHPRSLGVEFATLGQEFGDVFDLATSHVTFRRTLGLRVTWEGPAQLRKLGVYTVSEPVVTRLRVALDAGCHTPGRELRWTGYNAVVRRVIAGRGARVEDDSCRWAARAERCCEFVVAHLQPAHRYCHDEGLLTFTTGTETFTVSLVALVEQGPVWYPAAGVFIALAEDPTTFDEYRLRQSPARGISSQVRSSPEQSYAGAFHGQPRPHAVAWTVGCKHARQRFWIEPNGDVVLTRGNVTLVPGPDTPRYRNDGDGRFFFGLESWPLEARYVATPPILVHHQRRRRDDLEVTQTCLAIPLSGQLPEEDAVVGTEPVVGLVRFTFRNRGPQPLTARLALGYSAKSGRGGNRLVSRGPTISDYQVPNSEREALTAGAGRITASWHEQTVLRAAYDGDFAVRAAGPNLCFERELAPGESRDLVLKVPFVEPDGKAETTALTRLDFAAALTATEVFWRREGERGAQVHTPVPQLDEMHRAHLAYAEISDPAMPDDPRLVNTSVGTSTYGNFANESCMIIADLDQRGLFAESRRRFAVWLKYQGTVGLSGRFSDHDGVFYGAGGFEMGHYYCQHHGWVLWRMAEHYLMTRDNAWFAEVAPALIKGADWLRRQRALTPESGAPSRGWERGFLPAGGLEDVGDYFYWLSTNTMSWRGLDTVARALTVNGHPAAAEWQREAAAYGDDLRAGFETARRYAPLARLRDGRWVPHYPSRLYSRGRDIGWIREVLEGSVYLLISGLYDCRGPEAAWILEDYQDNRYLSPPFGYPVVDPRDWFDRGGFSIQPNLLAGLLPYLECDEPELYLWMFFNAWCACYREDINAMVEHPMPELGYSNTAHPKTSDEANAVSWLRYLFVYGGRDTLYLGRALPRAWFADGQEIGATGVHTVYGRASVTYRSAVARGEIVADVDLDLFAPAPPVVLRVRHPAAKPVREVTVDGRAVLVADAVRGDVALTGHQGRRHVVFRY